MKKVTGIFSLMLATLITISCNSQNNKLGDGLFAKINTTKGSIIVKLEMEKTPLTVANFVGLAEGKIKNTAKAEGKPYYDGIKFHRVIANFMIQGGDPLSLTDSESVGSGGPGYKFKDEFDPSLKHDRAGTLSMANAGPRTNGSQFFITHLPTPHLDGRHSVFGYVIEGQGTVDLIRQGDAINSIEIIRNGKAAKNFDAAEVFAAMR